MALQTLLSSQFSRILLLILIMLFIFAVIFFVLSKTYLGVDKESSVHLGYAAMVLIWYAGVSRWNLR